jgi:ribonuclease E
MGSMCTQRAEARNGSKTMADRKNQMVINYVPGEECRVAIVESGKLEELHVERFASASRVGNIYVGKVMNVEAAIQAAFVDFGVGENGFLHVSDLHPKYFPGEDNETTERVGFKTPRRERPSMQQALRRGDEVIVQVLKEGVGTKGPTLTSYLSIPGRFLVMMPGMDNVGVSRKVEDEDQRRKMREILDQLDLPEGFGFILRTAGMARTKAELKRDLAYLMRLWKDMEKRNRGGSKPRLLYSESDLLVRSLRDLMTNEVDEVVIDHEIALRRASRFMKIVAPRGTAQLLQYNGRTPIFHAFGIEPQVQTIHAREVPLPSGGRLVIDQTEALVAIDVNSGKSRDSRNSEENAYQTNVEAVDEICRQLRLRDMGGIVVNDLIDMRRAENRKDIESRFRERLKRDRARTTVGTISEFGILEMTRQRMRASHESVHFAECPTCRGRGLVQKPESVAADALRELAAILDVPRVGKAEIVVGARVAGELLSHKRRLLNRIERGYEKHVDVRVSEAHAQDRVSFYAYDESGADLALELIPKPRVQKDALVVWEQPASAEAEGEGLDDEAALARQLDAEPEVEQLEEEDLHPIEIDEGDLAPDEDGEGNAENKQGGRRRRRRGGRGRGREEGREGAGNGAERGADRGGAGGGRGQDRPMDRQQDRAAGDRGRGPGRGPNAGPNAGPSRGPNAGPARGPDRAPDRGPDRAPGRAPERAPVEAARGVANAGALDDVEDGQGDGGQNGPTSGQVGSGQVGSGEGGGEDGQRRRRRRRRRGRRGRGGEVGAGEVGGVNQGDMGPDDGQDQMDQNGAGQGGSGQGEARRDDAGASAEGRAVGREGGQRRDGGQSRRGREPMRPMRPPTPIVRDGIIFGDHGDEDEIGGALPASAADLPPPELDPNAPNGVHNGAPRVAGDGPGGDVLPVSRDAEDEEENGAQDSAEALDGDAPAAGGKRKRRRRRRRGGRGRGEGQGVEGQNGEGPAGEGQGGDAEGAAGMAEGLAAGPDGGVNVDAGEASSRAGEGPTAGEGARDGARDGRPAGGRGRPEPKRQPTLARGMPRANEGVPPPEEGRADARDGRDESSEDRRGGGRSRRGRGGRGPERSGPGGPERGPERGGRDGVPRVERPTAEPKPLKPEAKVARPEPKPEPKAPEVKAEAKPKPRTLYGNIKRKLNPSELNKRPKPE